MKDSDKRGDGGEAKIGKVKYNVQGTRYTLPRYTSIHRSNPYVPFTDLEEGSELVQNTAIVSD